MSTDANRLEPVDLSPLEFDAVEWRGRVLRVLTKLKCYPFLDEETQQLYIINEPTLDLHVFAPTRQELVHELAQHIFFAWDAYAKCDPQELTPAARELGQCYRTHFQEAVVIHAQA